MVRRHKMILILPPLQQIEQRINKHPLENERRTGKNGKNDDIDLKICRDRQGMNFQLAHLKSSFYSSFFFLLKTRKGIFNRIQLIGSRQRAGQVGRDRVTG